MNYLALLQQLLMSKKINVGGGAGAIILAIPTIMDKLAIKGEPTTTQLILGVLALGYILIQGHIDHGKVTSRIQALREFAGVALQRGMVPEKLAGALRELDGIIQSVDAVPTPVVSSTLVSAGLDVDALAKALLQRIPASGLGDASAKPVGLGTPVTASGTAIAFPPPPGTPGPAQA